MTQLKIDKRLPGISFNPDGTADIYVWAPLHKKAAVRPDHGQEIELTAAEHGYWHTTTDRIVPGNHYKIVLDGTLALPDPASLWQPAGVHQASMAFNTAAFRWSDQNWKNIPLSDYIIYELHTGTFTPEGNFKGIEGKIAHLKRLGITAIELMPVAQFPGSRNWGYDGVFPFAVQHSYGGPAALQHLVDTCHQHGLAVILDVVYNHLGPEGNYLQQFAPYFTGKYHTPWGMAINFDDAWCDGVRQYFIENVLMWFRDFHIDALRLDAVHGIRDFSPKHILREIKESVDLLMSHTGRKHYLIIECDLNDPRYINALNDQGYGMDAQWTDEFHHALRVTTGQRQHGYYADFNGLEDLAKAYKDVYVYDGQYSEHRQRSFGVKADNPGQQFVVFSQNHDQVGNRMLGERTSSLVSFEMQKLMAGAVLTAPYLPMLFMGEEYRETHPFLYFVSHGDVGLVEAVRNGRKAEFAAFHAEGTAPDPQSEETFHNSLLQWQLLDEAPHRVMLDYYRELIMLRKANTVLSHPNRKMLDVQIDTSLQVLQLHRWLDDDHILCFMNFSGRTHSVLMPPLERQWKLALDSAAPKWNGHSSAPSSAQDNTAVLVQPESILIYSTS